MSGTVTSASALLTAAEKAAKANSVAVSTNSTTAATDASTTASSALSSIAGNFNSFLTLLTTQLQNQDPSSPMDSNAFTNELATFAGVQQQVNTNTNLSTLISLNQDSQVAANTSLVGETANFTGTQVPLQSGTASIGFTTASATPVAIAISNASGSVVRTVQETSASGSNTWKWDGKDDAGNSLPDGAYGIAVQTRDSAGNPTALPFTMTGTITGVSKSTNGGVLLQLGSESVDMSTVNSVTAAAKAAESATSAAIPSIATS